MAEQTTNGAAGKPLWQQTPQGRAELSALAKKRKPHSTRAVPEAKIRRLGELVSGGATVKAAASRVGMGYSTAQRYERELRKRGTIAVKPARRASRGFRLEASQIKLIDKLLKADPPVLVSDIAKRAKCHVSSVYVRRKRMVAEPDEALSPQVDVSAGIPARSYRDFKHANDTTWMDVRKEEREPTDGEMLWTMAWRRMNRTPP